MLDWVGEEDGDVDLSADFGGEGEEVECIFRLGSWYRGR